MALATTLLLLPWPACVFAQQSSARVSRIGFLVEPSIDDNMMSAVLEPFRKELPKFGYREGRNMVLEIRSAEGSHARLAGLVKELIEQNPDVLVTAFPAPTLAAKSATTSIPVVGVGVDDPVAMGIAQTMARPGGNITGISGYALELVAKRLQLLREFVPRADRIAILANPDAGRGTLDAAIPGWERTLGAQIAVYRARSPQEFEGLFDAMARDGIHPGKNPSNARGAGSYPVAERDRRMLAYPGSLSRPPRTISHWSPRAWGFPQRVLQAQLPASSHKAPRQRGCAGRTGRRPTSHDSHRAVGSAMLGAGLGKRFLRSRRGPSRGCSGALDRSRLACCSWQAWVRPWATRSRPGRRSCWRLSPRAPNLGFACVPSGPAAHRHFRWWKFRRAALWPLAVAKGSARPLLNPRSPAAQS